MKKLTTGLIASLLLATSLPAAAERFGDRHGGNDRQFRADRYERQYDRHFDHHRHHSNNTAWGVLGAGLALGALALTIDAPRSPPVVIASPPPQRLWYFCESYRAYYPNVNYCPEGWRTVPAY
jgi:hypothetical protein